MLYFIVGLLSISATTSHANSTSQAWECYDELRKIGIPSQMASIGDGILIRPANWTEEKGFYIFDQQTSYFINPKAHLSSDGSKQYTFRLDIPEQGNRYLDIFRDPTGNFTYTWSKKDIFNSYDYPTVVPANQALVQDSLQIELIMMSSMAINPINPKLDYSDVIDKCGKSSLSYLQLFVKLLKQ